MLTTIVLTGGPCAGKTTVLSALTENYGDHVLIMPEVPTLLMANGFPRPGLEVPADDIWFSAFQNAVLPVQKNMEDLYVIMAQAKNAELLIFDRGMLDGAAYMPGGEAAFLATFNLAKDKIYARYDAVINLTSVAVSRPELWQPLKQTNAARFDYETLEVAQERDRRTREAWSGHPNWHLVPGNNGIEAVIAEVHNLVKPFLT